MGEEPRGTRPVPGGIGPGGSEPGGLVVHGEVCAPLLLDMAALRALPQHEREVTFLCRKSGLRRHRFAGPLLLDVATAARPAFAPGKRKDRLRFLLSLRGADGHRTVLSWGEIDPEFGDVPVLIGVVKDGERLDAQGPHLVVPGDRCGARNVSGLTDLHVYGEPPG